MNKLLKILIAGIVLAVMGGCAASAVQPEDAAAERAANQQKLKHNAIVNDNDCVTADAAARANALLSLGLTPEMARTPEQEFRFGVLYGKSMPECMKGKDGAATDGSRYGVTPAQLAWMQKEQECTRASALLKMLEGKEMAVVAGEGSTIEHFEAIAIDCGNWHNQRRADALVAMENAIRERCSRPRFFAPHPWVSGSFYDTCRQMGFEVGPSVIQMGVTVQPAYFPGANGRRARLMEKAGYDRSGQVQTGNGYSRHR